MLTQITSDHFILVADSDYIEAVGSHKILNELEAAFEKASYKLSFAPQSKITAVFYTREEFKAHWRMARVVMGYYDGKMRIPLFDQNASPQQMQPIILHELTHVLIDRMSSRQLPKWMDEGLAQWVEGRKFQGHSLDALVSHQQNGRVADLEYLDAALTEQSTIAYMKAFSMIEFLIERWGVRPLMSWIKAYGQGKSEQELFAQHYNADLRLLEEWWLDWLARQEV